MHDVITTPKHRYHTFNCVDVRAPAERFCICGLAQSSERNKYHAKRTSFKEYNYDSQKEANFAAELDLRKRGGDIKDWERQVSIPLRVYGSLVATYKTDFVITHNDGTKEIVEIKGKWTRDARIKWNLLEAIYAVEHPDVKLTVIQ